MIVIGKKGQIAYRGPPHEVLHLKCIGHHCLTVILRQVEVEKLVDDLLAAE